MKMLFLSQTGLNLGLAMRCEQDGHDVRYMSSDSCGKGLVRTTSEEGHADLMIFDDARLAAKADAHREQGIKVLGPSRWSSMLSADSVYRNQLLTVLGFPTNGVASGTNLYLSAWFNGDKFIATYASIVYRRFMPGGAGPDLACTGMLASFHDLTPKTLATFIKPLEKPLKRVNHRGPVHIHALIHGTDYCVRDINASMAHPLSLLMFEVSQLAPSELMLRLFDETSKTLPITAPWAAGVQLSVTPYPHAQLAAERFIQVGGIVNENINHLWLANVSKRSEGYFAHASGLVGYVTSRATDMAECVRRMYRTVGNLRVPDLQYRNDVGRGVQGLLLQLRQPGWLA